MKLLALEVKNMRGVPDGTHAFTEANGSPRNVVVLVGRRARVLLESIAALLEGIRATTLASATVDWWAHRRGPTEVQLTARCALSEGEAARVGASDRTVTSEWRLGPTDQQPREVLVGETRSLCRADPAVASYAYVDGSRSACWVGGTAVDPLAEALRNILTADAEPRASGRRSMGRVATHEPSALARLNASIRQIFPDLRLVRVACPPGGMPVGCFRAKLRLQFNQLTNPEREALYLVAALQAARVRDGIVLVDLPDLHLYSHDDERWLRWMSGLTATNQLFAATASPKRELAALLRAARGLLEAAGRTRALVAPGFHSPLSAQLVALGSSPTQESLRMWTRDFRLACIGVPPFPPQPMAPAVHLEIAACASSLELEMEGDLRGAVVELGSVLFHERRIEEEELRELEDGPEPSSDELRTVLGVWIQRGAAWGGPILGWMRDLRDRLDAYC